MIKPASYMEFSSKLRHLRDEHPRQVYNWLIKVANALDITFSPECTEHDLQIALAYHLYLEDLKKNNQVNDRVLANYKASKLLLKSPDKNLLQGDIGKILNILNITQKENEMKNSIKKTESANINTKKGVTMSEKSKVEKTTKVKEESAPNSRKIIVDLLLERKWTDAQIFEKFQKQIPDSKKDISSVKNIRNKLNNGALAPKFPVPSPKIEEIGGKVAKEAKEAKNSAEKTPAASQEPSKVKTVTKVASKTVTPVKKLPTAPVNTSAPFTDVKKIVKK